MPSPVAVHEAAHAVADHDLLPEFATPSVTVVPTETAVGCCDGPRICDCIDEDVRLMRRLMRALTIAKLVGCVAESRISGEDLATLFSNGGEEDWESARTAAHQYARCNFDRCLAEARRFVTMRWATILIVAAALDERKTLTGLEVEALVKSAALKSRKGR